MLEKILLAADTSDHAHKAVPAAAELARAGGGRVHALHVRRLYCPVPPTVVGDTLQEAQQLVDGVVTELRQAGGEAHANGPPEHRRSPAGAILKQAREVGAGMVVLGSWGLSILGLGRAASATRSSASRAAQCWWSATRRACSSATRTPSGLDQVPDVTARALMLIGGMT